MSRSILLGFRAWCDGVPDAPLVIAAMSGIDTVVWVLVQHGCPLYVVDAQGCTALEIAGDKRWNAVVEVLLDEVDKRAIVGRTN